MLLDAASFLLPHQDWIGHVSIHKMWPNVYTVHVFMYYQTFKAVEDQIDLVAHGLVGRFKF